MDELSVLNERCMSMHQKKEELIAGKRELLAKIKVMQQGINQLDELIELNLEQQQVYWPNCNEIEEISICNNVVSDYIANPNQTLAQLALKYKIKPDAISRQISRHFVSYGKNMEGVYMVT